MNKKELIVIESLEDIDEMLRLLDGAAAISDDELRRGFSKFKVNFPLELPDDPTSPEYKVAQMRVYEFLAGKSYSSKNEVSVFDVKHATSQPFPFNTQSSSTVGNHLIAIGHVIRTMNLSPNSSVLEFGPGWGNTTISLARMGHDVTAVDIEVNFVNLIKERAKNKNLPVTVLQGDFSLINTFEKKFDAILFFECFHHCSDHIGLVRDLDHVVAPGGKVFFAAEPIFEEFPLPWGIRLDGEAVWAIRNFGWLELGFKESYFRNLLDKFGWILDKVSCSETPWGVVFVASRKIA
ncbi:ubiquinone/menaquinone biosynthesis C-methylase UbiE [Polynucleobacter sphagniphilus]|uniref:class I SAM-dependent methyltransferase n=1 Tax=Polynucleobacter sphagniphilus TaxID=1743169 RepID=UPI002474A7E2|nr:class I SAM-dependent methyltransferase [Polynucleobacter sphagniphilus]MDH6420892.1 ubiquinone/menaquinone biosynthesis C-methylase UbiE [Polynucleobacter sphagniphilus]